VRFWSLIIFSTYSPYLPSGTRRRFDSRSDSREANWGWARVSTLETLLGAQGMKSAIIVGDAVDVSAYVRVVEGPADEQVMTLDGDE
jgi:hypothetical protein